VTSTDRSSEPVSSPSAAGTVAGTTSTAASPGFRIPACVLHREVDGEMVLLNLDTERYFGLDAIGADIVTRVTEQPVEAALGALVTEYVVDPEILRRDVDDLIADLLEAGLIERVEGAG
jgi:Coenzyme PQQ synthesis protein D (PqqD)